MATPLPSLAPYCLTLGYRKPDLHPLAHADASGIQVVRCPGDLIRRLPPAALVRSVSEDPPRVGFVQLAGGAVDVCHGRLVSNGFVAK